MKLQILENGRVILNIEAVREQALRAAECHLSEDRILQVAIAGHWVDTSISELRENPIS